MSTNRTFNEVQLDVKFTQAASRANLTSEENISISFGKLSKWYEGLIPTGGSSGQILGWNSDGTAKWVANPNTNTTYTFETGDSVGQIKVTPSDGTAYNVNVKNISAGTSTGTINSLAYYGDTTMLSSAQISPGTGLFFKTELNEAETPARLTTLCMYGPTYGNAAKTLISGTQGILSYGDGGPQIDFNTSRTGGQAGSLIFTDHDSVARGASWTFVSNQVDWNVISKRFHARTSISIGTNLPNTNYNLYVNGTTNLTGNTTISGTLNVVGDITQNGTTVSLSSLAHIKGIYAVKGTQSASTFAWTGNIDVSALYNGLTIAYYLPYSSTSLATLNLTLTNGSKTGAVNCYVNGTTRISNQYAAGSVITLTYWSAGSIRVNGTATTDNRWVHCG